MELLFSMDIVAVFIELIDVVGDNFNWKFLMHEYQVGMRWYYQRVQRPDMDTLIFL